MKMDMDGRNKVDAQNGSENATELESPDAHDAAAGTDDTRPAAPQAQTGQAQDSQAGGQAIAGLWDTLKLVLEVAVLALIIYLFVFQISIVKGASMAPTFAEHDRLIIDKVTYRVRSIRRFDVIVFRGGPREPRKDYIKRVIGLPGETVQLRDGRLLIDGELVVQDFSFQNLVGESLGAISIKDGHYFVLGDNRPHSTDSRVNGRIGQVPAENIRGRVRARIWPLDRLDLF